jgi:hypothetical protein
MVHMLASIVLTLINIFPVYGQEDGPETYAGYVATSLYSEEGNRWQTRRFRPGTSFEGVFSLSHQLPATEYLLTCILNYIQVPCEWNGEEQLLYPIAMQGGGQVQIPFTTPELSDAYHDFAILALSNVFSEDLSDAYRIGTDLNYLYRSRIVLMSDSADAFDLPMDWYRGGEQTSEVSFEGTFVDLEPRPNRLEAWRVERAAPGETIDYFIHVGNGSADTPHQTYAVMAFLDYVQVPIDGADQWVAFASMPPGTQTTIPARITVPTIPGIHELMIVHAYNPFSMLEIPTEGEEREATEIWDGIYSSIRTAIVVE